MFDVLFDATDNLRPRPAQIFLCTKERDRDSKGFKRMRGKGNREQVETEKTTTENIIQKLGDR